MANFKVVDADELDTLFRNIADAAREVSGTTVKLFPEQMPSYIRMKNPNSDTSGIPSDIVAEAERVASGMISKMGAKSLTFIAISDMHEMGDSDHSDATIIERYRRANLNAGQGAKLIAEKISLDFFANLGDLAWGSSATTLHDWAQSVVKARGYTAGIEPLTESFYTPGNHDVDYAGGYHDENLVVGMIGTYRYVDLTGKKVRVICLNTADTTDGTDSTERISGEQLQWFANALDLSGKSDADDWGIIVLSHHPIDWGAVKPLANCLAAYLNGTTYSATHDGVTISKNFSGKNAATFIANFHGHTHCFKVANISGTTVKRVAIPNACYGRNNEYGTSGNTEFGETTTYNKSDGSTGKNTAFCLVSIDLAEEVIYADCFGAGYDRVISYAEQVIVTYSITNNLSNASTSNGAATITEGSGYAAGITANDGYELSSIKVTMGGEDITSTAVSGSSITIGSVTGDIVITVTTVPAVVPPSYTNRVLTSIDSSGALYNGKGYQEGYRLNSSGTTSQLAGAVNSGFIPYNGEEVRIWGTTSANAGNSGNYLALYDANFAKLYVLSMNSAVNSGGTWAEKDGKYMLTVDPDTYTNATIKGYFASAKYVRASMVTCTGENFVITLDEEIT